MSAYAEARAPASWKAILCLWLTVPALAWYCISEDPTLRVRVVPTESELIPVVGKFTPKTGSNNRGYTFWTADGTEIEFGCEPDSKYSNCLTGLNLGQLSKDTVTIKLSFVPNPVWLTPQYIVMEITDHGVDVLTYRHRIMELRRYFARLEASKRLWTYWLADAIAPAAFFLFALLVTIRRIRTLARPGLGR